VYYNPNAGPQRYGTDQTPRPPNVFFDGTRLGLEGTMLATLGIGIPAGLHIGLSVALGYAQRFEEALPAEAKAFSLMGFLFGAILATIAMAMVLFFLLAIPTMAYSMVLIALMLRWVGKRWPRQKLASTSIGGVMGLLVGLATSAIVFTLVDIIPSFSLYGTIFRWPEILTVDGIVLLWFTVSPLLNAGAGAQIGWRLGKQLDAITQYWFW
jgi:hypothetical protein